MRHTYIVTYDVCSPYRLRRVYKTLRGYGEHLQLSVFRCDLHASELTQLQRTLAELIHPEEDQILFIVVGRSQNFLAKSLSTLGRPSRSADPIAIIV